MRKLSVIQVVGTPWWSGAGEPALLLASDLAKRGHRVKFVCVPGGPLEAKAVEEGMPPAPNVTPTRSVNPKKAWRFVSGLASLVREVNADVAHVHLTADHWLAHLALKCVRRDARLVRSVHHPRAVGGNIASKYLLGRAADALIPVSRYLANLLSERVSPSSDRVHVVSGGVDLERFRPADAVIRAAGREILNVPPDVPLIGTVTRLAADREIDELLAAFQKVAEEMPGVRLAVIGRGEFLPRLKERARTLGIQDRVGFHGYHGDDLVEALAALDVFALMSPGSEGTCRAALEAMAVGLPCVVTDKNGLSEIVEDGETARVAPLGVPGTTELMASAFKALLADERLRVSYGRAGRERVERLYDRARRAELVERVYARTLRMEPEPNFGENFG